MGRSTVVNPYPGDLIGMTMSIIYSFYVYIWHVRTSRSSRHQTQPNRLVGSCLSVFFFYPKHISLKSQTVFITIPSQYIYKKKYKPIHHRKIYMNYRNNEKLMSISRSKTEPNAQYTPPLDHAHQFSTNVNFAVYRALLLPIWFNIPHIILIWVPPPHNCSFFSISFLFSRLFIFVYFSYFWVSSRAKQSYFRIIRL